MRKALAALIVLAMMFSTAAAEWIICKPDSYVKVRRSPSRKAMELGRMELGDEVTLTGRVKNGYAECTGLAFEEDTGWIHAGYIVEDEPEIIGEIYRHCGNGRTALRKWVNGPRRAWATAETTFKVYAMTDEWALTSRGFIRTQYIEPEGR